MLGMTLKCYSYKSFVFLMFLFFFEKHKDVYLFIHQAKPKKKILIFQQIEKVSQVSLLPFEKMINQLLS